MGYYVAQSRRVLFMREPRSKKSSQQYSLMREGKTFHFDDYLFSKQKACAKVLAKINHLPYGNAHRKKLISNLFDKVGVNTVIKEGIRCNFGFNVSIGNNCYINYNVTLLDSFPIEIGNNVFIAPNVVISAVTHPLAANDRRNLQGGLVKIEDDVWIGANATILPNVTLGKGCVIAAGAVVKNNVKPYTVVGGMPAKLIKIITD